MQDHGLPLHGDLFSTGESANGCGNSVRTVHQGIRTTGADFITKGYKRDNITIKTSTLVDKVVLEKDSNGKLRATGVAIINADGSHSTVHASHEVIVSGGSYMSPAILLRSGIGAKSDLEALGIDCVVDLPAVGKNLEDHLIVFTFYEVNQPGLTNDHLVYHGDNAKSTYELYKDTKTGFLSTFPFGAIAYARLDDRLAEDAVWQDAVKKAAEEGNVEGEGRDPMGLAPNQPNVEYFSVECYGGPKQYVDAPIAGQHVLGMVNLLFHARSRGSVTLASADPHENPKIDCNYLDDPLDMVVLSEACRFSNEFLLKGKGTKSVLDGSWPRELTHHAYYGREEWEPYVRQHATTCEFPLCFFSLPLRLLLFFPLFLSLCACLPFPLHLFKPVKRD